MPQIGPDLWKVALSFFWWRQYQDGRIEQEFDPLTGQIQLWGETPTDLKRAGWLPVTADLARKMAAYGEFGTPTQAPSVLIDIKPGEELEIFKDCQVLMGKRVTCKACGEVFHALGHPEACPKCGARVSWRCPKCNQITDQEHCPSCKVPGRQINPFHSVPDKWEEVVYILGINGKFTMKFNSTGLIAEH